MELDEFITASIAAIMKGVSDAVQQHDVGNVGGFVNPRDARRADSYGDLTIQEVEFNVAVTVESSKSVKKEGGFAIKVIEASLSGQELEKTVGESRVKFTVPLALPGTKVKS